MRVLLSAQLPESVLRGLSPDAAARVRAFFRGAKQRVADLSGQLVRLVDVQVNTPISLQHACALYTCIH